MEYKEVGEKCVMQKFIFSGLHQVLLADPISEDACGEAGVYQHWRDQKNVYSEKYLYLEN
jgi:hypothetical protein